jgi:hypothetical protein
MLRILGPGKSTGVYLTGDPHLDFEMGETMNPNSRHSNPEGSPYLTDNATIREKSGPQESLQIITLRRPTIEEGARAGLG